MSNRITYFLKADIAIVGSPRGVAYVKQDHLQTKGRQMPQNHHQGVLHMSNRITYSLKAGRCHKTITKGSCICQTGSLTY